MTQVFLSHSTTDAEFALRLASDLREAGVPVWKAPESILEGERWVQAITRGVTTSTHMLILMSPAAVESDWVNFEFEMALPRSMSGQMNIIPLEYQGCQPPASWAVFQYFKGLAHDYDKALLRLIKHVHQQQPPHPPQPTLPTTTITVTGHGYVAGGSITYAGQPAEPPTTVVEPRPELEIERLEFEPEMILIPAGPFLMGSPKSDKLRYDNEPEQFELDLDYDYAFGRYPVTVGQYRTFVEAGGYQERKYWTEAGWEARGKARDLFYAWAEPRFWNDKNWVGDDQLPVIGVSWYEVYAYTCWLAETTGRDYRLPTEAEWEKAARGGLHLPDGKGGWKKNPNPARVWPWGNESPNDKLLNFNNNAGCTTPVGQYPEGVSPYGVFDMAGNVWEWCLSQWADPYVYLEHNNPQGDSLRVVRSGSWRNGRRGCRVSSRSGIIPDSWFRNYGFRVGSVVPLLP